MNYTNEEICQMAEDEFYHKYSDNMYDLHQMIQKLTYQMAVPIYNQTNHSGELYNFIQDTSSIMGKLYHNLLKDIEKGRQEEDEEKNRDIIED